MSAVPLLLTYPGAANMLALLWLLPASDRDKVIEILALRHQIVVLERQLGKTRPRFLPSDRVFLALLHCLPRDVLGRFRLLVRPDTVLRWHRDLMARRNAARSRPKSLGRESTAATRLTLPAFKRHTRGHRTGLACTNLHGLRQALVFYPIFYPKGRIPRSAELFYLFIATD
jgi:hypothetical protein